MIIHLVRHTTPAIDEGICYGQTDLDLSASFQEEKKAVMAKLKSKYDVVYTSPLKRCSQLAAYIASENRVTDDRLMEYNFGDWELKPWNSFKSESENNWMNNFVDQAAPNGDSLISMQERVMQFWHELLGKDYHCVAVVTHSGVQRLIHAHVLDTPMRKIFRLHLDFGAVMEIKSQADYDSLTISHL